MSDELPPPPDTLVVGEFTVHLRQGVNRVWLAKIADRDGPRTMVRGQGRDHRHPASAGVVQQSDETA